MGTTILHVEGKGNHWLLPDYKITKTNSESQLDVKLVKFYVLFMYVIFYQGQDI